MKGTIISIKNTIISLLLSFYISIIVWWFTPKEKPEENYKKKEKRELYILEIELSKMEK